MKDFAPTTSADFYSSLLKQVQSLIVVMDKESRFIYSNKYTANMFGYTDEESLLGDDAYDINCRAVESAENFINQDQLVIQKGEELTILDIHEYAHQEHKILLTKKYPYRNDSNEIIGSICQASEIPSDGFAKICSALTQSDKMFRTKKTNDERSYLIGSFPEEKRLSSRELDCMFFLLRGKSVKEIGKALEISPRTVETHLDKIKIKLGQYNKKLLIEYGISAGYLNYIPSSILTTDISAIICSG